MGTNMIALPCMLGDRLYCKDGMWECIGFECDQNGLWNVKIRQQSSKAFNGYYYCRESFDSFGKTVFTSEEECEKVFPPKFVDPEIEALAERQMWRSQYFLNKCLAKGCFD